MVVIVATTRAAQNTPANAEKINRGSIRRPQFYYPGSLLLRPPGPKSISPALFRNRLSDPDAASLALSHKPIHSCGVCLGCYPALVFWGVFLMKILARFSAVALLLVMAFSQSTYAGESFPIYSGDYFHYYGDYPPAPLIVPYGYYRCAGGCCRRPVWSGQHWHNVNTCSRALVRPLR